MKKDLIWSYLIHLSSNMWNDPGSTSRYSVYSDTVITDDATWKEVVDFLPSQGVNTLLIDVGDALEYESHPEISIKGAWSKDKLKAELDRIRALGMTPIPKLNFSATHDAWLGKYSHMLSTPEYHQVCADLIKEVAEVFGNPELFHLGMDEEDARHQQTYQFCCIRQGDLWWKDLFHLFDQCEKVGARPWLWGDYVINHEDEFVKRMPKSALLSNWEYKRMEKNPDGSYVLPRYEAYRTLEKAGFDQVPTCSAVYGVPQNARDTMLMGKEEIAPERLLGYMTAPWFFTTASDIYALKNDALRFGEAKKQIYPECK